MFLLQSPMVFNVKYKNMLRHSIIYKENKRKKNVFVFFLQSPTLKQIFKTLASVKCMETYEECSLILVTCLIFFSVDNQ